MYEETVVTVSLYRMYPVTLANLRTIPNDVEILGYNIPAQVYIYVPTSSYENQYV